MRRFLSEGEALEKLIGEHGRLYISSDVREDYADIKDVVPVELSDYDKEAVEQLSDQYGVASDIAETLLLAKKLKAKQIITTAELPDELSETIKEQRYFDPH